MLIRSQDKKALINLECIDTLFIHNMDKGIHEVSAYRGCEETKCGDYSTEDKAIKVLDMIQAFYVVCESMKTVNGNPGKRLRKAMNAKIGRETELFVFRMPTDEEMEDI